MKIKEKWIKEGKIDTETYTSLYNDSIKNNDDFWSNQGDRIHWYKKFTKIKNVKYCNTCL